MRRIRGGYSLIELSVVITLCSTLMVIAAGWIHQSLKLGSIISARQEHHQTLLRLSRRLRDDVNRGESMTMRGEDELVISFPDSQEISYQIDGHRVRLRRRNADAVSRQDAFGLSPSAKIHWQTDQMPSRISLLVDRESQRKPGQDLHPVNDLHVQAGIARWRQLEIQKVTQ